MRRLQSSGQHEGSGQGRDKRKIQAKGLSFNADAFSYTNSRLLLTAQQPYNNIVRTAIQALAAVLGGTQSLHTNSMDETLSLPTERAVTIALRTQQIIAYESGVTNTIDPLGGAYFIEALTNKVEEEVYKYFKKIDELGGMVEAIQQGFPSGDCKERPVVSKGN